MGLEGKIAIVTGGNRGIGLAIAERLAAEGARILSLGRNKQDNERALQEINGKYPEALKCYAVDVADERAVADWFRDISTEYEQVDILVNNAGICNLTAPFAEISSEQWTKTFDVNFYGVVHLLQQVIPIFKRQKSGKIVNVASLAAEVGGIATAGDYVGSKAALLGITKSLARELGPYNVNVNAVAPGFVRTRMTEEMNIDLENIPLRRIAEPRDIANAVHFLVSEESRCITGTTLDVNGGLFMK